MGPLFHHPRDHDSALANWGGYGAYPDDRNPTWYDHDAVIGGRLFHVYCAKGSDGQLRYDFGGLDGTYGRYGWKMIAFVPDVMPLAPGGARSEARSSTTSRPGPDVAGAVGAG